MAFSTRLLCLIPCLFFTLTGWLTAQEGQPTSYAKVLFLGNSITKHGPKADIDWTGNWGMAASAEDKDYVHLVVDGLTKRQAKAPAFMVGNIADFERNHASFDVEKKLADAAAFQADLIILAIGENVTALKSDEAKSAFKTATLKALQKLKSTGKPMIIVRSCFWANPAKDEILKQCSDETGCLFVNISQLGQHETNYARSERPYKHEGVARHPGDKGMRAIADAILEAISKEVK